MKRSTMACLVLALALTGCASGARMSAMTVPVQKSTLIGSESLIYQAITVVEVSGGQETNALWMSKVSNESFRAALESTLLAHTILAKGEQGRFELRAQLTRLEQPFAGFDMTVTAGVRYVITEAATATVIFDHLFETPYKAEFGDALSATERLRLANEGAMLANIDAFIHKLVEQLGARPVTGELKAGS